jgi:hypothetical protein
MVGFGTWQVPPRTLAKAVEIALRSGYRNIDCASILRGAGGHLGVLAFSSIIPGGVNMTLHGVCRWPLGYSIRMLLGVFEAGFDHDAVYLCAFWCTYHAEAACNMYRLFLQYSTSALSCRHQLGPVPAGPPCILHLLMRYKVPAAIVHSPGHRSSPALTRNG